MLLKRKIYQVNDYFIICGSAEEAISIFKEEINQDVVSLVQVSDTVIVPDEPDRESDGTERWVTDTTDNVKFF